MNDCTRATRSSGSGVTPSRIIASLQSCKPHCLMNVVVLIVGAQIAEPADQRRGRIDLEDPRALGELLVGHLQEPLHLGAHPPFDIHQAARAVGQPFRFAHLADPRPERFAEELEDFGETAFLRRRTPCSRSSFSPDALASGISMSAESIEVSFFSR